MEFVTIDGKHNVTRLSRWITIQHKYRINKNNGLFDFSTDGNGYRPTSEKYDPSTGTYLDYFRFEGRNYAIDQFVALGSIWCGGKPYQFTDTDGTTTFVTAVDFSGDIYDPLYIELDEYGEQVRVYQVHKARH